MRSDELLILNYRNFSERVASVYERLHNSESMKALFVSDPTGLFAKTVFPEYNLTSSELNQGNRLLFSLLSNSRFLEWSKQFEERLKAQLQQITGTSDEAEAMRLFLTTFDRTQLYREIAQATLEFGDLETIFSLTVKDPNSAVRRPLPLDIDLVIPSNPNPIDPLGSDLADVAVDIETFIYAVAAVAVFIAAVALLVVPPPPSVRETLTREDLMRVTNFMAQQLGEKARTIRQAGLLTSMEGVMKGPRL
jgi:hypothetical protein